MYDHPAAVQVTSGPSREALRNARGHIIGYIERQHLTGRILARDPAGRVIGTYDARRDQTRDAHGILVGSGYVLPALVLQAR